MYDTAITMKEINWNEEGPFMHVMRIMHDAQTSPENYKRDT